MKTGNWKRVISIVMAMCLLVTGLLVGTAQPVKAETESVSPEMAHISVGKEVTNAIRVEYAKKWDHIENLKTSSKNLAAKITYMELGGSHSYGMNGAGWALISLYAGKAGTYQVTFDIYNEKNKKISDYSVTVYANNDCAVKKITFAGKKLTAGLFVTDLSKGKLSVTMNDDYILTEIMVTTYDKNGKSALKIIENNSTITLGNYIAVTQQDGQMYKDYYYYKASLFPTTEISVRYTDKYTGLEKWDTYSICRMKK